MPLLTPILLSAVLTLTSAAPDSPSDPRGRYVEARTASLLAGACHYGSEATTTGREALLAWRFEGGVHAGVALAGVDAVAVVTSDRNLAEPGKRSARLYVSDRASEAQRAAVRALLEERLGATLGTLSGVEAVPMTFQATEDDYALESKGLFELRGATLADRACCSMPSLVWYAPLAPVQRPIVGLNAAFRCDDKRVGRVWSRPDENASFSGRFRFAAPAPTPTLPMRSSLGTLAR
jgi:hypothetical protein